MMKRAMRCHDFGTGREATRSQYREYWQGERQCHGPKLVPAQRVAAKTGADFVGRLDHIRDMLCAVLRVSTNFGSNAHVFHYVRGSNGEILCQIAPAAGSPLCGARVRDTREKSLFEVARAEFAGEFVGRAGKLQPSGMHDRHAVAHLGHVRQRVGSEEQRAPGVT